MPKTERIDRCISFSYNIEVLKKIEMSKIFNYYFVFKISTVNGMAMADVKAVLHKPELQKSFPKLNGK